MKNVIVPEGSSFEQEMLLLTAQEMIQSRLSKAVITKKNLALLQRLAPDYELIFLASGSITAITKRGYEWKKRVMSARRMVNVPAPNSQGYGPFIVYLHSINEKGAASGPQCQGSAAKAISTALGLGKNMEVFALYDKLMRSG